MRDECSIALHIKSPLFPTSQNETVLTIILTFTNSLSPSVTLPLSLSSFPPYYSPCPLSHYFCLLLFLLFLLFLSFTSFSFLSLSFPLPSPLPLSFLPLCLTPSPCYAPFTHYFCFYFLFFLSHSHFPSLSLSLLLSTSPGLSEPFAFYPSLPVSPCLSPSLISLSPSRPSQGSVCSL